nr:MAG TPA: hypothetical protein [Caudoviricetes sp.]
MTCIIFVLMRQINTASKNSNMRKSWLKSSRNLIRRPRKMRFTARLRISKSVR